MRVSSPQPLTAELDTSDFRNQQPDLVQWLQRRALANEEMRASRTFATALGHVVIGYYALAAGAVEIAAAPGALRRNMPAPIPAIVLGRLAVDDRHQGRGLGTDLLGDALRRSLQVSAVIGARVLVCHAIDPRARAFYLHHGFRVSPTDPLMLMLDLRQAAALWSGRPT